MKDWGSAWLVWVSEHLLSLLTKACSGKTPDWKWYNLQSDKDMHIYAGCRRGRKEALCRKRYVMWRNRLLGHFNWPFHCSSISGFHQGISYGWRFFSSFFIFIVFYFFFFSPHRGQDGGRAAEDTALAALRWSKLKGGQWCQGLIAKLLGSAAWLRAEGWWAVGEM